MAHRDQYREQDTALLWDTIEAHPFGVVLSLAAEPCVTHLPFVLQRAAGTLGTLTAHLAATNPLAAELDGRLLVVFNGPHAYISPRWYSNPNRVPTWNDVAVHVRGRGRWIDDNAQLDASMDALVARFEGSAEPRSRARLSDDQYRSRLKAIRLFEIEIEHLEGVFKLSQDKPAADQQEVIAGLERGGE